MEKCAKGNSGGEANLYKCDVPLKPGLAVALRVAQHSGATLHCLENALLAVLHKQLVHDNVLGFLGVVEYNNDLRIVMPWYDEGDAVSYLESPDNQSHTPNLVCSCSLWSSDHPILKAI